MNGSSSENLSICVLVCVVSDENSGISKIRVLPSGTLVYGTVTIIVIVILNERYENAVCPEKLREHLTTKQNLKNDRIMHNQINS